MQSAVSNCNMLHSCPSTRQWSVCVGMFHTAALPLHSCPFFEKDKKRHYDWLKIICKWSASAQLRYALGAVFAFVDLITSQVLTAGTLGLGLHGHFDDQTFPGTERGSAFPSPFPASGRSHPHRPLGGHSCPCSCGRAGQSMGLADHAGKGSGLQPDFLAAAFASSSLLPLGERW